MSMSLLALVGPTASGKTAIALELAPELNAEILSVDSMQVYRGLDVGTAKPSSEELARVPHHLLDLTEPGAPYNVADFQRVALRAIAEVRDRGARPLLSGGSGLYYRAVVDQLDFPPTDPNVRARIDERPVDVLWKELRANDPEAAKRIDPRNKRRIVRALEVREVTGKPFSTFRTTWEAYDPTAVVAAGLLVPPEVLRHRIEDRARGMFKGPLQEETRHLLDLGLRDALLATPAIGYRQAIASIDGLVTQEEALEDTVRATMALARRQMRWFRRDPRIVWFDATELDRTTAAIRAYWEHATSGGA